MSEYGLWICDRCRATERTSPCKKPTSFTAVTVDGLTHQYTSIPTKHYDLCRACSDLLDKFLRNEGDVVRRAS